MMVLSKVLSRFASGCGIKRLSTQNVFYSACILRKPFESLLVLLVSFVWWACRLTRLDNFSLVAVRLANVRCVPLAEMICLQPQQQVQRALIQETRHVRLFLLQLLAPLVFLLVLFQYFKRRLFRFRLES